VRKLTSQKASRQFVVNVMKEHGFDPGPKRGEKTSSEFLEMHADSLWQCDFFAKKVVTLQGVRDYFMIVFLHVGSRKVFVTPDTDDPTAAWVAAQATAFCHHLHESGSTAQYLYHDHDRKYGTAFDGPLKAHGIEVRCITIHSPNLQGFVERWIQSFQTECLDYFVVLGQRHLDYVSKLASHIISSRDLIRDSAMSGSRKPPHRRTMCGLRASWNA
jgi:putative transposase